MPATTAARQRTRELTRCALAVALISVCAWISIPAAVPFTMQTFGIFLVLALLGGRWGSLAVGAYLLLGAVGVPVFAGFTGGLGSLLNATGGYKLGFLFIGLTYWLLTRLWGQRFAVQLAGLLLGLAVCYAFGTAWFLVVYVRTTGPMELISALSLCVFPFLIPDFCKLGLALLLARRLRPRMGL